MPNYFGPGRTSTTKQIINRTSQSGSNPTCVCAPPSNNKKLISNKSEVNANGLIVQNNVYVGFSPQQTQNQRISTIIHYSPGGKVQYGNPGIAQSTTFLGKTAGQPGGIVGPLKNKF